jgi:hypothetical protein
MAPHGGRVSPQELLASAQAAISRKNTLVPGAKPHMYLTLPAPKNPGYRVRLLKNAGPLGELCAVTGDRCIALFDPYQVVTYLTKQGVAPTTEPLDGAGEQTPTPQQTPVHPGPKEGGAA